jgi:uncharacterized membrane protein YgcG
LDSNDAIEFIIYDSNDNQLPQKDGSFVKYISLTTENIRDYFLIAEGTYFHKHKLPAEYFIDIERLLKEAGYDNGIFKTQISLVNKRVGSEIANDKLWISEISPSRTEIRLFPIRSIQSPNPNLEERFFLFSSNGEFRDDTIEYALKFIEEISPLTISSFIKSKYREIWFNKMVGEFKMKDFETFSTNVYNNFLQSAIYEFTNKVSKIDDVNYGKPLKGKPSLSLSKTTIKETYKKLLIEAINYTLPKQNIITKTTFDTGIDTSMDEVGKILQKYESSTMFDTSNPVLQKAVVQKPILTDVQLHLEDKIKKELPIDTPVEKGPIKVIIATPDGEPDYVKPKEPSNDYRDTRYKNIGDGNLGQSGTSGPGGGGGGGSVGGGGGSDYSALLDYDGGINNNVRAEKPRHVQEFE